MGRPMAHPMSSVKRGLVGSHGTSMGLSMGRLSTHGKPHGGSCGKSHVNSVWDVTWQPVGSSAGNPMTRSIHMGSRSGSLDDGNLGFVER